MINVQNIQAMFGLKWNPFSSDVPTETLYRTKLITDFCWRIENIVLDGGFALVTGDPGLGKSTSLRIIADHLSAIPELSVKLISLPNGGLRDFYRQLAELYDVDISISNRFGNFNKLRTKWISHISNKYFRPVIIVDEAQDINPEVLMELRTLGSTNFDSRCIVGTILAGDKRLPKKLDTAELLPLLSRIRAQMVIEPLTNSELAELLKNSIEKAGNPDLMTPGLRKALVENSMGNPRTLMYLANEVLSAAAQKGERTLTEEIYLEICRTNRGKKR